MLEIALVHFTQGHTYIHGTPSSHPSGTMAPTPRLRVIKDIANLLLVPPFALSVLVHILHIHLRWWSPAYLLSILLAAVARVQYTQLVQRREARQLGARPIPCVVGKWPGNIDVMLRMRKAFASDYIYNPYLQLFEEYQCTTLNTRFLWMDNVSISRPFCVDVHRVRR